VTRHQLEKKGRFRRGPFELLESLLLVPSALCFIEHNDMLVRRVIRRTAETLLKEISDVLDPSAHLAPNLLEALAITGVSAASPLISGQRLAQHDDEGCIARQINNVAGSLHARCHCAMNNVQSGERFARPRHTSEKEQVPLPSLACLLNESHQTSSRRPEVVGVGICDAPHIVSGKDTAGGVNDVRDRTIGRAIPILTDQVRV
jgi:hypothetical protein